MNVNCMAVGLANFSTYEEYLDSLLREDDRKSGRFLKSINRFFFAVTIHVYHSFLLSLLHLSSPV